MRSRPYDSAVDGAGDGGERMTQKKRRPASKTRWAYAYRIVPPQAEDQLRAIQTLLDREHSDARRRARTWEGRFVLEEQITHILVVSDSPDQDRQINRRLGLALNELEALLRPGIDRYPRTKT